MCQAEASAEMIYRNNLSKPTLLLRQKRPESERNHEAEAIRLIIYLPGRGSTHGESLAV